MDLSINVTTVLPTCGRVGHPTETSLGAAGRPLFACHGFEKLKMVRPPDNYGSNQWRLKMRSCILVVFVTIAFVIPSLAIAAGDVPNLKGTWTGKLVGMKHGKGDPKSHRTDQGLRKLTTVDMTLTIDFQQGRVFSGTHSSAKTKET
ncbi:MAG: hypothetical protein P8182_07145, partial [Deltaproteobacteria bacterium]